MINLIIIISIILMIIYFVCILLMKNNIEEKLKNAKKIHINMTKNEFENLINQRPNSISRLSNGTKKYEYILATGFRNHPNTISKVTIWVKNGIIIKFTYNNL